MNRLLSFFFVITLLQFSSSSHGTSIEAGFDLLKTKSGELKITSLPGIHLSDPLKIKLKGKPLKKPGAGNTDTVIQRKNVVPKKNAGIPSKIDIKLKSLSLKSIDPVEIGGEKFDVLVKLDSNKSSKGKLDIISHDDRTAAGDFLIRNLSVFLQVTFTPISGNALGVMVENIDAGEMNSTGGRWSHNADSSYPTIPNFPAGNLFLQPFSLASSVLSLNSLAGASVSIPGSLLLLGSGLVLIGWVRSRGLIR